MREKQYLCIRCCRCLRAVKHNTYEYIYIYIDIQDDYFIANRRLQIQGGGVEKNPKSSKIINTFYIKNKSFGKFIVSIFDF